MSRLFDRLGQVALILALVVGTLFAFGPREPLDLIPVFDAGILPENLDEYLARREDVVGGITPGVEKRIVWANDPGAKSDWAVVYLHGFSATSEEIRPVPDRVADELGANLYFARFAGHGLAGERLAEPTVQDWMVDVAEALAIGNRIGERVLVIATSTGGTLAAEAALQPALADQMDGIVFISPNFGLQAIAANMLTWPFARSWVSLVAGTERCFEPQTEAHKRFWTTCYPTTALLQMGALAAHAGEADYSAVSLPALFLFSDDDQVVSPASTERVTESWGGRYLIRRMTPGPEDDAASHVIAGDALSPSMTAPVTERIVEWALGL